MTYYPCFATHWHLPHFYKKDGTEYQCAGKIPSLLDLREVLEISLKQENDS